MTAATIYRISVIVGLLMLAIIAHCWRRSRGVVVFLALCLWSSGASPFILHPSSFIP